MSTYFEDGSSIDQLVSPTNQLTPEDAKRTLLGSALSDPNSSTSEFNPQTFDPQTSTSQLSTIQAKRMLLGGTRGFDPVTFDPQSLIEEKQNLVAEKAAQKRQELGNYPQETGPSLYGIPYEQLSGSNKIKAREQALRTQQAEQRRQQELAQQQRRESTAFVSDEELDTFYGKSTNIALGLVGSATEVVGSFLKFGSYTLNALDRLGITDADIAKYESIKQKQQTGQKLSIGEEQFINSSSKFERLEDVAARQSFIDSIDAGIATVTQLENTKNQEEALSKFGDAFDEAANNFEKENYLASIGDFLGGVANLALEDTQAALELTAKSLPQMYVLAKNALVGVSQISAEQYDEGVKEFVKEHGRQPDNTELATIGLLTVVSAALDVIGAKAVLGGKKLLTQIKETRDKLGIQVAEKTLTTAEQAIVKAGETSTKAVAKEVKQALKKGVTKEALEDIIKGGAARLSKKEAEIVQTIGKGAGKTVSDAQKKSLLRKALGLPVTASKQTVKLSALAAKKILTSRVATSPVIEGSTEAAQNFLTQLASKQDLDKIDYKEVATDAAIGAIAGGVLSGTANVPKGILKGAEVTGKAVRGTAEVLSRKEKKLTKAKEAKDYRKTFDVLSRFNYDKLTPEERESKYTDYRDAISGLKQEIETFSASEEATTDEGKKELKAKQTLLRSNERALSNLIKADLRRDQPTIEESVNILAPAPAATVLDAKGDPVPQEEVPAPDKETVQLAIDNVIRNITTSMDLTRDQLVRVLGSSEISTATPEQAQILESYDKFLTAEEAVTEAVDQAEQEGKSTAEVHKDVIEGTGEFKGVNLHIEDLQTAIQQKDSSKAQKVIDKLIQFREHQVKKKLSGWEENGQRVEHRGATALNIPNEIAYIEAAIQHAITASNTTLEMNNKYSVRAEETLLQEIPDNQLPESAIARKAELRGKKVPDVTTVTEPVTPTPSEDVVTEPETEVTEEPPVQEEPPVPTQETEPTTETEGPPPDLEGDPGIAGAKATTTKPTTSTVKTEAKAEAKTKPTKAEPVVEPTTPTPEQATTAKTKEVLAKGVISDPTYAATIKKIDSMKLPTKVGKVTKNVRGHGKRLKASDTKINELIRIFEKCNG